MLVDSHCHLEFDEFKDDLDGVLARAKEAGVIAFQTIGTRLSHFPDILKIAEKYAQVYCSFGIHPHEAEKDYVSAEEIVEYCKHPKVIGIGETGLDYYYEHSPRDIQVKLFKEHIKAAQITGLPLIIHTRDADQETMDILEAEYHKEKFTGLIHCFSASNELASRALQIGFYISVSGILTFKKADRIQEIIKAIPLDRILVETDAPFLAPVPMRGKVCEPAFVRHTAQFLANLKEISFEEVAKSSTDNFFKLFNKAT